MGAATAAAVFSAFADAAERAGCDPLLAGAWRDAALDLEEEAGRPAPDSVRRIAAEQVDSAAGKIRDLCARSTPRLERLRQIRLELASPPADTVVEGGGWFAPVYFEPGRGEVADDSVRRRLRALGGRLAAAGLPVTLVVEGFSGSAAGRPEAPGLALARARWVLGELRRGGLGEGCCVAAAGPTSVSGDGGPGDAERLGRRVTFAFDYREVGP